jgi:hypothetical protein
MAIVFISYDRAHQDVVTKLVQDLRDDEHETWFDQKLEGGQPWWDTVLSEIRKSEIFVTALTPESLESQACQRELRYALELKRPVLPIRLSAAIRPEFLPFTHPRTPSGRLLRAGRTDSKKSATRH